VLDAPQQPASNWSISSCTIGGRSACISCSSPAVVQSLGPSATDGTSHSVLRGMAPGPRPCCAVPCLGEVLLLPPAPAQAAVCLLLLLLVGGGARWPRPITSQRHPQRRLVNVNQAGPSLDTAQHSTAQHSTDSMARSMAQQSAPATLGQEARAAPVDLQSRQAAAVLRALRHISGAGMLSPLPLPPHPVLWQDVGC